MALYNDIGFKWSLHSVVRCWSQRCTIVVTDESSRDYLESKGYVQ